MIFLSRYHDSNGSEDDCAQPEQEIKFPVFASTKPAGSRQPKGDDVEHGSE